MPIRLPKEERVFRLLLVNPEQEWNPVDIGAILKMWPSTVLFALYKLEQDGRVEWSYSADASSETMYKGIPLRSKLWRVRLP